MRCVESCDKSMLQNLIAPSVYLCVPVFRSIYLFIPLSLSLSLSLSSSFSFSLSLCICSAGLHQPCINA